jgi:hypothetical protein
MIAASAALTSGLKCRFTRLEATIFLFSSRIGSGMFIISIDIECALSSPQLPRPRRVSALNHHPRCTRPGTILTRWISNRVRLRLPGRIA